MKKHILLMIIIIVFNQNLECGFKPSVIYEHFGKTNSMMISFELNSAGRISQFGAFEEFTAIKLSAGEKYELDRFSHIYDLGLVTYQSIIRIPILKNKSDKDYNSEVIYDLPKEYATFLTFSYQGLSFKNSGIYDKEFNWSSIGVDLLYKKFQKTHFYTKLSFIASANTLENNRNYFTDIDSAYKKEFCFSTKVSSLSKLLLQDFSSLRFEAYYRNFYNYLNQKEIACSLGYEFNFSRFIANSQIGYTIYGAKDKWKGFISANLGLSYRIIINGTHY